MANTPKNSVKKYLINKIHEHEQCTENSSTLSNGGDTTMRRLATLYLIQKVSELSIKHPQQYNRSALEILNKMRHTLSHLTIVNMNIIFNEENSNNLDILNSNSNELTRLLPSGNESENLDIAKFKKLYQTLNNIRKAESRKNTNSASKLQASKEKLKYISKNITSITEQETIDKYEREKKQFFVKVNENKPATKRKQKTKNSRDRSKNKNDNQEKLYKHLSVHLHMNTKQIKDIERKIHNINTLQKPLTRLLKELANPRSSAPSSKANENDDQSPLDAVLRKYNQAAETYVSRGQCENNLTITYEALLQYHYQIHKSYIIDKAKAVLDLLKRIRDIFEIRSTLSIEIQDRKAYTPSASQHQESFFKIVENDFQMGCYSRTELRELLDKTLKSNPDQCDAARFSIACVWEALNPLVEYDAFKSLHGGRHIRNYIYHNDPTASPQALFMERATTYTSDSPECISQQLYMLCINVYHNLNEAIEKAAQSRLSDDIPQLSHHAVSIEI